MSPASPLEIEFTEFPLSHWKSENCSSILPIELKCIGYKKTKDKTTLALGIRDGSIGLEVKAKKEGEGEKVTLKSPE